MSSLGEPLVASIEIPDINNEERASLKTALASPDAFRIAGMEYNAALASTQITLMRRDNGDSYLLLRSDKVVTDPFVNLVINANWSTGRIVRNYTLLLDPPAAKQSETAAVTAPIAVLAAPAPQAIAPTAAVVSAPVAAASARVAVASGSAPTPVAMPKAIIAVKPAIAVQKTPSTNTGEQIKVGNGDTAGKIAANNLPSNVSLEQMLVAMLRGNPKAFIGNNVNRLKAGAVLDLPTEAEASAISTSEAKQHVIAQSKDFNGFRHKLAENAPALASNTTGRVASGKIEAKVEDKKTATAAPDKLTLSKGELVAGNKSATAAKENLEKTVKERQAKDDATRSNELAKNIKDLNKIANAAPVAPSAAPQTPLPVATIAVPATPAAVATVTSTPVPVAPLPAAPKPAVATKAPVVAAPASEPSALDFLMDDPVVLPAAAGLLAMLLAGGLYANSQRKKRAAALAQENDLPDEHFEEKSFFSDTSNEPVMENEVPAAEVSKVEPEAAAPFAKPEINELSPPAVNAHAAVDPLTEASVYLDYGRDAQAEEILKDGLKTQPENVAIYAKLMDIYAKRRDSNNFEQMALKAKLLLTETDPQWLALSKQGFELEPSNPLYRAGATDLDDPFVAMSSTDFSARTVAQLDTESAKSPASVDLDLDFDFASDFPASIPTKEVEVSKTPLVSFPDFSLESMQTTTDIATPPAIEMKSVTAVQVATPVASNMPKPIEFDLGHLSLDLNSTTPKSADVLTDSNGPLETKLALAQEFRSIGDVTGAKMLAHEVLALASGNLKTRAEALLAQIG
jgi:pilus assembly protein FimV